MKCIKCQQELNPGDMFCQYCGTRVQAVTPAPAPVPQPVAPQPAPVVPQQVPVAQPVPQSVVQQQVPVAQPVPQAAPVVQQVAQPVVQQPVAPVVQPMAQQPQVQAYPAAAAQPEKPKKKKKIGASILVLLASIAGSIFAFMAINMPTESKFASSASIHSACEAYIWLFWTAVVCIGIAWLTIIVTVAKKNKVLLISTIFAVIAVLILLLPAIHYSNISKKYKLTDPDYKLKAEDLDDLEDLLD